MNRVKQLDNENIIIITNDIKLTPEIVDENRAICRELLAQMTGPVVLIVDYRKVEMTFADTLKILQGNQSGKRKDLNQRTFTIFVGTHHFIHLYRNALEQPQFGAVKIPLFTDLNDALAAGRLYLQQHSVEAVNQG